MQRGKGKEAERKVLMGAPRSEASRAGQGWARESRAWQGRTGAMHGARPGHAQNLGFPRRRPRASFEGPEYLVKTTILCEHGTTTFPEVTVWGLTVIWSLGESEAPQSSRAEEVEQDHAWGDADQIHKLVD